MSSLVESPTSPFINAHSVCDTGADVDNNNKPQLSLLSVNTPPGTSPFPSPSSTFIPPPRLGAHEFAVWTRKAMQSVQKQPQAQSPSPAMTATEKYATNPEPPKSAGAVKEQDLDEPSNTITLPPTPLLLSNPATPTKPKSPMSPLSSPSLQIPTTPTPMATHLPSTPTSTRPAPPSPASSRRASRAISTTSSAASSPGTLSRANSSAKKPKRASKLSMSYSPAEDPGTAKRGSMGGFFMAMGIGSSGKGASKGGGKAATMNLISIVDFAFPVDDPRRTGQGLDVPKPNRITKLNKKLGIAAVIRARSKRQSGISNASSGAPSEVSTDSDSDEEEESREDAMRALEDEIGGGFKWGIGRLSWGFGFRGFSGSGNANSGGPTPTDFERNFVDGEAEEEEDEYSSDQDEQYDEDDDDEEAVLVPGLYRAMYAFVPEGTAEMALNEDQVVRVVGRGGGVGWAIVAVDEDDAQADGDGSKKLEGTTKKHALVPESYLELVQADPDPDD